MDDYLMKLLKPRIDKEKQDFADQKTMLNLYSYVQRGGMTVDFAANEANQEPSVFIVNMRNAGFTAPDART